MLVVYKGVCAYLFNIPISASVHEMRVLTRRRHTCTIRSSSALPSPGVMYETNICYRRYPRMKSKSDVALSLNNDNEGLRIAASTLRFRLFERILNSMEGKSRLDLK